MEVRVNQQVRRFQISEEIGAGLSCGEAGAFVGETPLLERRNAIGAWRPRPLEALNAELGKLYGLPVALASRQGGRAAVAGALEAGDIARARIAALHLQLPDPPPLTKASDDEIAALAYRLLAAGLLAKTWDEAKHPRWPAKSPDSVGGQFAPADAGGAGFTGVAARATTGASDGTQAAAQSGQAAPASVAPMDAANQNLLNAINSLRSGNGSRSVNVNGTGLVVARSGSRISMTVDLVYTLHGDYSATPGVAGVDIRNVQMSTIVPGVSIKVLPDSPGGSTELVAQVRVGTVVAGRRPGGTQILQSAVGVIYNHTIVAPFQTWQRGVFYTF
jgi:hypothetical protein